MRLSMRRLVEAILGLAAAALLALLVVPWKEAPLPAVAAAGHTDTLASAGETRASTTLASPEAILTIFAGRPALKPVPAKAPAAAPMTQKPEPQPAPRMPVAASWLRYMGRSSAGDGASSVWLKDTKSGKVIRAALGATLNGWTLLSEDDAGLVLTHDEDLYAVSKR